MIRKALAIACIVLLSTTANANELIGYWQHESQPVTVEILQQDGETIGIIRQQTERPEVIGRTLYQQLAYSEQDELWRGQIYVFRMKEFRDVSLKMLSGQAFKMTVKVGFMSRSFTWHKVEAPQ